jgi:hypothetical protein
MKSKLLPFSFLALILGFTTFILASGWISNDQPVIPKNQDINGNKAASEYLNKMISNQITGKINPNDVLSARKQALQMQFKSGNELGLNWQEMGPDNTPGRVRAVVFDNTDPGGQTLIAAGVTGGLWKTTNLGATWNKIDQISPNIYVTCMVQSSEGTIYAGTGEAFCTETDTYYGGLVGQGMFKSTDQNNFELIPGTTPVVTQLNDTVDWAYINNIALDPSSERVYAATNTGLWYSDNGNTNWLKVAESNFDSTIFNVSLAIDSIVHCDTYEIVGDKVIFSNPVYNAPDTTSYLKETVGTTRTVVPIGKVPCASVSVASDGTVAATFANMVYTAPGGTNLVFTNQSKNPVNPKEVSKENREYATTLFVYDTLNPTVPYSRTLNFSVVTEYGFTPKSGSSPLSNSPGRTEIAFAPSDPNVLYVVGTGQFGYLDNIYLSENKGETWEIILPGGSSLEIFNGTGCYNNTIAVFPDDAHKILVGGIDMWYGQKFGNTGGYYNWGSGAVSSSFFDEASTYYLPTGHHRYVFSPTSSSKLAIATDRGVSLGTVTSTGVNFQRINRNLSITQCYTVGVSGNRKEFLCGAQGNGTQYISGNGNTPQYAEQINGGNGGSCAISVINPDAFIYSQGAGVILRSEDKGATTSFNFTAPGSNIFLTPFVLWEDFECENSRDSIMFYADKDYLQGDMIVGRSDNYTYPFNHMLDQNLADGDSITIKDVVQSKFFHAIANAVYVTKDVIKFGKEPDFWKIANTPGFPTSIAVSKDANFVFVGTDNGKLYRISNIALAYDSLRADVGSTACIIATNELAIPDFANRFITSVSVDQRNPEHVIVTLGNYGNESYVFRSTNALDSASVVTFTDITSNLPKMPVFSSIIEQMRSNVAIIGTEYGIYTTSNLGDPNPVWVKDQTGVGMIPVYQIKQQTIYKPSFTVANPDPNIPPLVFPEVTNYGDIYMATFGRGVFSDKTFHTVGINETVNSKNTIAGTISIFPNPVKSEASLTFETSYPKNILISIYDLSGKVVKTVSSYCPVAGKQEVKINCSDLKAGTYVAKVSADKDSGSLKFIVR